jgi:hypothetical protein
MAYYNSSYRNNFQNNSKNNAFIEGFTKPDTNYILMGDGILNNTIYVPDGQSVNILIQNITGGQVVCLAKDGSVIANVYTQLTNIPTSLQTSNTKVLLSVGLNDILNLNLNNIAPDTIPLLFTKYIKLVETIQNAIPNTQIVLFDVCFVEKYQDYYSIIQEWNTLLFNYIMNNNLNYNFDFFRTSFALKQADDFTSDGQISATGSQDLVNAIQNM